MFYNVHSAPQTLSWDKYYQGVENNRNIEANKVTNLEQKNPAYIKNKRHEIEKVPTMKTTIEHSQISPTESLDSVGSLALSSIDNSNSESIDDNEASQLR